MNVLSPSIFFFICMIDIVLFGLFIVLILLVAVSHTKMNAALENIEDILNKYLYSPIDEKPIDLGLDKLALHKEDVTKSNKEGINAVSER